MLRHHRHAHNLLIQGKFFLRLVQANLGHALRISFVGWIMLAGLMVGAKRVGGVHQCQAAFHLRHMRRSLLPLAGDQVFVRAASDYGSRARRTLRQQRAKALALANHLGQLHHHGRIAIANSQTAGVLHADPALLKALHRPCNCGAARDGVHAIHIAQRVRTDDRIEVVDGTVTAKGGQCFVLGPAVAMLGFVRPLRHLGHALAAHRAAVAGIAPKAVLLAVFCAFEARVIQRGAVNFFPIIK